MLLGGRLELQTDCLEGAAFVELYFVLSSIFASRAYYAFGFLALTSGKYIFLYSIVSSTFTAAVVVLTTATVTILFTYFVLCAEEYRWHWRAFLVRELFY